MTWMVDYARTGRLLDIPWRWATGLGQHLVHILRSWWAPAAVILFFLMRHRKREENIIPPQLLQHLILYTAAGLVFWCFVGLISHRLTLTHFPLLLVALAALTVAHSRHACRWIAACVALSLGWHMLELSWQP